MALSDLLGGLGRSLSLTRVGLPDAATPYWDDPSTWEPPKPKPPTTLADLDAAFGYRPPEPPKPPSLSELDQAFGFQPFDVGPAATLGHLGYEPGDPALAALPVSPDARAQAAQIAAHAASAMPGQSIGPEPTLWDRLTSPTAWRAAAGQAADVAMHSNPVGAGLDAFHRVSQLPSLVPESYVKEGVDTAVGWERGAEAEALRRGESPSVPAAMARGAVTGLVQGGRQELRNLATPLNIALTAAGFGESALVGRIAAVAKDIPAIEEAMAAAKQIGAFRQMDALAQEARAAAQRLSQLELLRTGIRVGETAAGASFTVDGAKQIIEAPTWSERIQAVPQLAGGLAMMVGGASSAFQPSPVTRELLEGYAAKYGKRVRDSGPPSAGPVAGLPGAPPPAPPGAPPPPPPDAAPPRAGPPTPPPEPPPEPAPPGPEPAPNLARPTAQFLGYAPDLTPGREARMVPKFTITGGGFDGGTATLSDLHALGIPIPPVPPLSPATTIGGPNAPQAGQVPRSDQPERPRDGPVGPPAEAGGGGGVVERPAPPPSGDVGGAGAQSPITRDVFTEIRDRVAARHRDAEELAASGDPVMLSDTSGRRAIAGPDMSKPGTFRVTHIGADGQPTGHTEHPTLQSAVASALGDGFTPTHPPASARAITGFTTAKGSTYIVDGPRTTRFKTVTGEQHGPSDRTIYLAPDVAARAQATIESFGDPDGPTTARPEVFDNGHVAIIVKDRATGKVNNELSRSVPGSQTPAVGLHPFEVWNLDAEGVRRWHFGNPITAVERGATSAAPVGAVAGKRPTAVFAFHQPDEGGGAFPMYHVQGGPLDKSTVSAATLREHGIDVPDTPAFTGRRPAPPPAAAPPAADPFVAEQTDRFQAIRALERTVLKYAAKPRRVAILKQELARRQAEYDRAFEAFRARGGDADAVRTQIEDASRLLDTRRGGARPAKRAGAPQSRGRDRGRDAAPRPDRVAQETDTHWPTVLADARADGFAGSDADLRTAYDAQVASLRRLIEDVKDVNAQHSNAAFLDAILRHGGLKPFETSVVPGVVAGTATTRFKVDELRDINEGLRLNWGMLTGVARNAGKSLDDMRDVLVADGWPLTSTNDLLDRLTDLSRSTPGADQIDPTQILPLLGNALGVRPGNQWWPDALDEGATDDGDTSFDVAELEEKPTTPQRLSPEELAEQIVKQEEEEAAGQAPQPPAAAPAPPTERPLTPQERRAKIFAEMAADLEASAAPKPEGGPRFSEIPVGSRVKAVAQMVRLIDSYLDEGVTAFEDVVKQFHAEFPNARAFDRALELAWQSRQGETRKVADVVAPPKPQTFKVGDTIEWYVSNVGTGKTRRVGRVTEVLPNGDVRAQVEGYEAPRYVRPDLNPQLVQPEPAPPPKPEPKPAPPPKPAPEPPKAAGTVTEGTYNDLRSSKADAILAVHPATHQHTLWLGLRDSRGVFYWHYLSTLGANPADAIVRARARAQAIANGEDVGRAFSGNEQFGTLKHIGLATDMVSADVLRGPDVSKIGDEPIGFGKYGGLKVKELLAKDPGYAAWLVGSNPTGRRAKAVADYIKSDPEFIASQQKAEAAAADAITPAIVEAFQAHGLTITATDRGTVFVSGKTFDWKDAIKAVGGRFSERQGEKGWEIPADRFGPFAAEVEKLPRPEVTSKPGEPTKTTGIAQYLIDPTLKAKRAEVDATPDRSAFTAAHPESVYVSPETAKVLIDGGRKIGMPQVVVEEQVEDVARIVRAYDNDQRLFLLASEPGSGKTFVLGGAIKELQARGAKTITYVTLRQELITQIQRDLGAFGITDVQFVTYPAMREADVKANDVLIFDEAHSVKNVGDDGDDDAGSAQANRAAEWIGQAKMTVLASATPFENPVQMAYLAPTGLFDDFKDFDQFAKTFGASTTTIGKGDYKRSILVWKRTPTADTDAAAARGWLLRQGIYTSRPIRLPAEMVDSRLVKMEAPPDHAARYQAFSEAAASINLQGFARPWVVNFQKRLLEAAKVNQGIVEAKAALARGRYPIIFVETKAERILDIPDLIERQHEYEMAVNMALMQRERPPARSEFGLPPSGIVEVLSAYMDKTGEKKIEIPSAEDLIKQAFGDKVAIFTGSVSPAKAQKNLDAWRAGTKPVLVATMAKGGTGLSLHDKVGDHQTTQININLPWTASGVVQVAQRSARYGLKGRAEMQWVFATNIPFDKTLARKVGGRMADLGSVVQGKRLQHAAEIEDFDFEHDLFSEAALDDDTRDLEPPAAAAPIADTLDTGETQTRLPGAEGARKAGKADVTFKAPQQASGDDFDLTQPMTPEAKARAEAEEKAKSPSLFEEDLETLRGEDNKGDKPLFSMQRKAELEQLATDEAMGVTVDEDDDEPMSLLPDGSSAVVCTHCALRTIELNGGKGDLYGWEEGANPTAVVAHDEGHDFAVLDGRYLVDAWAKNVEGSTPRAVFDLDDPRDRAEVRRLYGDPSTWVRARNPTADSLKWKPGAPPQLTGEPGPLFSLKPGKEPPGYDILKPHLTEAEADKLRTDTAANVVRKLDTLPPDDEFEAAAEAGAVARGWYRDANRAIADVFGPVDAPRFTALASALSPQVGVRQSFLNAAAMWAAWDKAERPDSPQAIIELLQRSITGKLFDAWVKNTVRALTADDPIRIVLSGPKVHSFYRNLLGDMEELTNDTWMAHFADLDQKRAFSGEITPSGRDPGKGAGYLAFNAKMRRVAARLTARSGQKWTPAEVQGTIWAWIRTVGAAREATGDTAETLVRRGDISPEVIRATTVTMPELLAHDEDIRGILEDAGYGKQLRRLRDALAGPAGTGAGPAPGERAGAGGEDPRSRRALLRAARRFDARRDRQAELGEPDPLFSRIPAPPFYSRLQRAVEASKTPRATGKQWKGEVANSKLGINKEEYALVGVDDLDNDTVYSKAEVLEYLRANEVKVEPVVLGGEGVDQLEWHRVVEGGYLGVRPSGQRTGYVIEPLRNGKYLLQSEGGLREAFPTFEEAVAKAERYRANAGKNVLDRTKFKDYQMSGSDPESYREVILTAPHEARAIKPTLQWTGPEVQTLNLTSRGGMPTGPVKVWSATASGDRPDAEGAGYEIKEMQRPREGTTVYVLDSPGIFRERGVSNGQFSSLAEAKTAAETANVGGKLIREELGRRPTWVDGHPDYNEHKNPIVRLRFNVRTTPEGRTMVLEEVQPPSKANQKLMPALFVKHWRDIAFKWALRHAAEQGYDAIAWTPGQVQADRYTLEKQVKSIAWAAPLETDQADPGDKRVVIGLHKETHGVKLIVGADGTVKEGEWTNKPLSDVIGKEVAQRIQDAPTGTLEGEGLKIGGEGLKRLYDVDFRNVAKNLPAVKRTGAPVGTTTLRGLHQGFMDMDTSTYHGPPRTRADVKTIVDLSYGLGNTYISPITGERQHAVIERVDIHNPAREVLRAMDAGQSFRAAIAAHGNDALARVFGGTITFTSSKPSELEAPALTITPELREAVLGSGQPLFAEQRKLDLVGKTVPAGLPELARRTAVSLAERYATLGFSYPIDGRSRLVLDNGAHFTPEERDAILVDPDFQHAAGETLRVLDDLVKAIVDTPANVEQTGIVFDDQIYGVYVQKPGTGGLDKRAKILLNLAAFMEGNSPQKAADLAFTTAAHEALHHRHAFDGPAFERNLGRVLRELGAETRRALTERILDAYADPADRTRFRRGLLGVLQRYTASRGRPATAGDSLRPPGGGAEGRADERVAEGQPAGDAGSGGRRVVTVRELEQLAERRGSTVAAERARALRAGYDVHFSLIPGAREFLDDDVAPVAKGVAQIATDFKNLITPQSASPQSQRAADLVREAKARAANAKTVEMAKYQASRAAQLIAWLQRKPIPVNLVRHFDGKTDDENIAAISHYERTGDFPPDAPAGYAHLYRESMALARALLLDAYGEVGYVENYVRRQYEFGSQADADRGLEFLLTARRSLAANRSPTRHRILDMPLDDALTEMRARGIEVVPTTTNPEILREWSLANAHQAAAMADAWRSLKASGLVKWVPSQVPGAPALPVLNVRAGGPRPGRAPAGWVLINERGAAAFYPKERGLGQYYADPNVARVLNNAVSKGLGQYATYQGLRRINNALNELQLGLSAFHATGSTLNAGLVDLSTGLRQLARGDVGGTAGIARSLTGGLLSAGRFVYHGRNFIEGLKADDPEAYRLLTEQLNPAGGRLQIDTRYRNEAVEQMFHALRRWNVLGALWRVPFAVVESAAAPLMSYTIPRLKLGVLLDRFADIRARYPNIPEAELHRRYAAASDQVDNIFGLLVYDNGFWDKTAQDLAQVMTRSVGWTGGSLRWGVGAGADAARLMSTGATRLGLLGRGGPGGGSGGPGGGGPGGTTPGGGGPGGGRGFEVSERLLDALLLPLYVGLLGAVYMYLHTRKAPETALDYYYPQNGRLGDDGKPSRSALPTYMKDAFAYGNDPIATLLHKTSPLANLTWELTQNEDYWGDMIRDPHDPLAQRWEDIGRHVLTEAAPFSMTQGARARSQGGGALAEFEAFAGFPEAPRSITQTAAEKLMRSYSPTFQRTPEQKARAILRSDIRQGVRRGTPEGTAQAEAAAASGDLSKAQIKAAYKGAGAPGLVSGVKGLTLDQAIEVYTVATPVERGTLFKVMYDKRDEIKRAAPNDQASLARRYADALQLPATLPR